MPMGRPSKYTPELLEMAQHYVDNYEEYDDPIPSIAGLACELGISRDTLHTWAKDPDKVEFSDIYIKLMSSQERSLLKGGLRDGFSPAVTKMVLTKHGYSDRVEQKVEADLKVTDMTDEQLDQKLEGLINAGSGTE